MKMSKLTGSDVHQILLRQMQETDEINRFFRYDSPLVKLIVKHIAGDDCVIIEKEGTIVRRRGTGPAVTLRDFGAYATCAERCNCVHTNCDAFWMEFLVVCVCRDDNDNEKQLAREYLIRLPLDLLTDFTQEKFDQFIAEKRTQRDEEQKRRDLELLSDLAQRYPDLIKIVPE